MKVAVLVHTGKSLGAGPSDLRLALADSGVTDPLWFEVPKSKKAPKCAKRALREGAELVFVWGGDGMVQRTLDALAGSGCPVAIVPAGTANLLATNLGIPKDIIACVKIGLSGTRRPIDLGTFNGEHFAVLAGVGFDAQLIADADAGLKEHFGRLAYIWTGAKNLRAPRVDARIKVDGKKWFDGCIACVLVGNVGSLFGGVTVFQDACPDDGRLEVGVVTAKGAVQWARALARIPTKSPESSPFVDLTAGTKINIRLETPMVYELDGGDRKADDRFRIRIEPGAATICVLDEAAHR